MTRWLYLAFVVVAACSGDNNVHHLPDAPCVAAANTITLVTPTAYSCHDPFKATVTVMNDACHPLTVTDVKLVGVVTNGPCSHAAPGTYPGTTIGVGQSGVALDLTAGPFCCTAPGPCPASFQCDEDFTFTVDTPDGPLMASQVAHLSLDSCDVVCP